MCVCIRGGFGVVGLGYSVCVYVGTVGRGVRLAVAVLFIVVGVIGYGDDVYGLLGDVYS